MTVGVVDGESLIQISDIDGTVSVGLIDYGLETNAAGRLTLSGELSGELRRKLRTVLRHCLVPSQETDAHIYALLLA